MAYQIASTKEFERATKGMKRKNMGMFRQLMAKIQRISEDPYGSGHPMSSKYRGLHEVHLQNYLIIYRINEATKIVELVSYVDHDTLP